MQGKIVGSGKKAKYFIDGQEVTKRKFKQAFPERSLEGFRFTTGCKPHLSNGLAVHPDQVEEATESAIRKGVPTEFRPDGRPVMRSRFHQKQYLKAYGMHNNDGGYGD